MTVSSYMNTPMTIAVDAMGGDHGVDATIPGAAMVLKQAPATRFILFGDENKIRPVLARYSDLERSASVYHTDKMVMGTDRPSAALRASKGTSMRLAIEAVEKGDADAVVSSGNTGALMAMAKVILKTLPGIHRPAIASVFPTKGGDTIMLDLGANVLVDAETLAQFAVLGAVFAKAHKNIPRPTVGLLNVGVEENKGPDHVRAAAAILSRVEIPGQFTGFVEGDDITKGVIDVIVTDGYAGNIALKTVEGAAKLAGYFIKQAIKSDPLAILGGLFAFFALKRFQRKVDPRLYNGGVFLGLNGICIKSHGGTDALGFASAIYLAGELVHHGYIKTVGDDITHLMSQEMLLAEGTYQG